MFHKGHFLFRLLGVLLLIAVLIGGGALLFRSGQAQGYAIGLAASGKELTVPAPGANPGPSMFPGGHYGYGFYPPHFMPFFAPFGCLAGGMFLLFFFFAMGGILRMFAWRHMLRHAGPGPNGPSSGWHRHWGGPTPPWANPAGEAKPEAPAHSPDPAGENKA